MYYNYKTYFRIYTFFKRSWSLKSRKENGLSIGPGLVMTM